MPKEKITTILEIEKTHDVQDEKNSSNKKLLKDTYT